jgi:phosphoglycerol transferase MdoB-like AlkP superfamily enzyme
MIELIIGLSLSFLTFLIMYGILNKIKIFEKSINFIVSLVVSLFVLFAFTYYQDTLYRIFSFFSLLILLLFIFLSSLFFGRKGELLL